MSNSQCTVRLEQVALPAFGMETVYPQLSVAEYQGRLQALAAVMESAQLDVLVVYGDREHFGNLAYLTGFDPRFEEALLLLDRAGHRVLVVGNECMGYLPDPALRCEAVLFQEFSLLGQPRESRARCATSWPTSASAPACALGAWGGNISTGGWWRMRHMPSTCPGIWWICCASSAAGGSLSAMRRRC